MRLDEACGWVGHVEKAVKDVAVFLARLLFSCVATTVATAPVTP